MTLPHVTTASITGTSVVDFLQGYITCDLSELYAETATPMAITDIKGRVVGNGWVFGDDTEVTLLTHSSVAPGLQQHLAPYMRFTRCEMTISPTVWFIAKSPDNTEPTFELGDAAYGFTESSENAIDLDTFQIKTGYVLVTEQTTGKFLPQMLNLTEFDAVSFTKGCYLGQEVVARAQHRGQVKRQLSKALHENPDLVLGEQVMTEDGHKATIVARDANHALVVSNANAENRPLQLVTAQAT